MNISKLTKALSPANLAELSEITISPDFSITILQVAGINQVSINEKAGLDFATALRSEPFSFDLFDFAINDVEAMAAAEGNIAMA